MSKEAYRPRTIDYFALYVDDEGIKENVGGAVRLCQTVKKCGECGQHTRCTDKATVGIKTNRESYDTLYYCKKCAVVAIEDLEDFLKRAKIGLSE